MDWNIKPRSETCQLTGRAFQDGDVFHTALYEGQEDLDRLDYSEDGWSQRDRSRVPVSSWRSVFKAVSHAEAQTVDPTDAESVLRHLLVKNDPAHGKTCLLLALLLERKRRLKLREKIETEFGKTLVYEHPESQDTILVPDMEFHLSELAALVGQLEQSRDIELFGRQSPAPESAAGA